MRRPSRTARRQGRPTVAALLGPSAAVLVGDFWLARAVELVVEAEHREAAIRLFSNTLTDQEMLSFTEDYPDPEALCHQLMDCALERDARDNVTVIAVAK